VNVVQHSRIGASLLGGKLRAESLGKQVVEVETTGVQASSAEDAKELLLPSHLAIVVIVGGASARRGLVGFGVGLDVELGVVGGVVANPGCGNVG